MGEHESSPCSPPNVMNPYLALRWRPDGNGAAMVLLPNLWWARFTPLRDGALISILDPRRQLRLERLLTGTSTPRVAASDEILRYQNDECSGAFPYMQPHGMPVERAQVDAYLRTLLIASQVYRAVNYRVEARSDSVRFEYEPQHEALMVYDQNASWPRMAQRADAETIASAILRGGIQVNARPLWHSLGPVFVLQRDETPAGYRPLEHGMQALVGAQTVISIARRELSPDHVSTTRPRSPHGHDEFMEAWFRAVVHYQSLGGTVELVAANGATFRLGQNSEILDSEGRPALNDAITSIERALNSAQVGLHVVVAGQRYELMSLGTRPEEYHHADWALQQLPVVEPDALTLTPA